MSRVSVTHWPTKPGKTLIVYTDLKGERKVKQFETDKEAYREADRVEAQLAAGSMIDDKITVSEYVKRFLELTESKVATKLISRAHLDNCRLVLTKYLVPVEGSRRFVHLTKPVVRDVLIDLLKKYKPTTVHLALAIIRTMFAEAIDEGVITENPSKGLAKKLGLKAMTGTPKAMTMAEAGRLMKYAREKEPQHHLALSLYLKTGMRLGEGLALRREDFDYEGRKLHVRGNASKFGEVTLPKTEKSIREVQIPQDLAEDIREELSKRVSPWILAPEFSLQPTPTQIGRARRRIQEAMKDCCIAIKLPGFTIHCLRHTFATTHLERRSASMFWISRQLGHASSQTTTDIYGAFSNPQDSPAVEAQAADLSEAERKAKYRVVFAQP